MSFGPLLQNPQNSPADAQPSSPSFYIVDATAVPLRIMGKTEHRRRFVAGTAMLT
jgi:hypothetical protein